MNTTKWVLMVAMIALLVGCSDDEPADGNGDANNTESASNANQGNDDSDAGQADVPDDVESGDTASQDAEPEPEPYDGPTYHDDIAPMMQAHCTGCHVPDSVAPFALQSYEEVKATASASHVTMVEGTMPPWPPADDCGEFQGHRGISDQEIDLFEEWIDGGHVQGEPDASSGEEIDSQVSGVDGDPDLTLDWGFDFKPDPPSDDGIDDYRCFVIDPEIDEDKFVNLVDTRPGNPELVHHMIAYMAPADQSDHIDALLAEDDQPGYECFGGPGFSDAEMLTGWAPGALPLPYKEGHGVRLAQGTQLVVQMHYNTLNDPDGTDRTEFDLYFVDEEEYPEPTELLILPLGAYDLFIEAGDPEAEAYAEGPEVPFPITLHGIAPHMHLLGTEIYVDTETGDGDMCLIDVPDWDFDWQGFFLYEESIELAPPVKTRLTCRYDNSADNQPPGRTPEDVYWGDGTYDEMCLVYFIIDRPPGF